MAELLYYFFLFALLAFVCAAAVFVLKSYFNGQSPGAALFGPRPEKRLAVVEHQSIDGRRRLVLIRRDGVEHLIMTGGPVDVVIETGIGDDRRRGRDNRDTDAVTSPPVFARTPRNFGQRPAGEQAPDRERVPERAAE